MFTPTVVFNLIIVILTLGSLFSFALSWLNLKSSSSPLPDLLKGIYDDDKYQKQQEYHKTNFKFGNINSLFSLIVLLVMLFADGFAYVNSFAQQFSENPIFVSVIFFAILAFASDLIGIPFEIYDTFVIEKKFGFNKTTYSTFVLDKIKSWLISGILGGGLVVLVTWIFYSTGEYFWILTWLAIFIFSIIMNFLYSDLIVPLFNKQKPLEEGELKDAINEFAEKTGFSLKKIMVIDGSKRSTKANAYFSGFGPRKRVVLYDTLIAEMSTSEIVAVLAHEIGHYKKKHIFINLIISALSMAFTLYLMSLFLKLSIFSQAIGINNVSFHSGILVFAILFSPLSGVMGIFSNMLSRRHEYAADTFAAENYHSEFLISALKKLTAHNMSSLTPHRLYVFFNYSHPPLLQRINNMLINREYKKSK